MGHFVNSAFTLTLLLISNLVFSKTCDIKYDSVYGGAATLCLRQGEEVFIIRDATGRLPVTLNYALGAYQFQYNAVKRRVVEQQQESTAHLIYNNDLLPIAEFYANETRYRLPGNHYFLLAQNSVLISVKDRLGSVRGVLHGGDIQSRIDYDTVGRPVETDNCQEDCPARAYPYRFQGHRYLAFDNRNPGYQPGIHDFSGRLYDHNSARFTHTDLLRQYYSPYMAMGGDWINSIDPDGRSSENWDWLEEEDESEGEWQNNFNALFNVNHTQPTPQINTPPQVVEENNTPINNNSLAQTEENNSITIQLEQPRRDEALSSISPDESEISTIPRNAPVPDGTRNLRITNSNVVPLNDSVPVLEEQRFFYPVFLVRTEPSIGYGQWDQRFLFPEARGVTGNLSTAPPFRFLHPNYRTPRAPEERSQSFDQVVEDIFQKKETWSITDIQFKKSLNRIKNALDESIKYTVKNSQPKSGPLRYKPMTANERRANRLAARDRFNELRNQRSRHQLQTIPEGIEEEP